jgi:rRNA maturation endonuclease Nob1
MRLFKRKTSPDDAPRCPECRERVPGSADECAMCGHDLAAPSNDAAQTAQRASSVP